MQFSGWIKQASTWRLLHISWRRHFLQVSLLIKHSRLCFPQKVTRCLTTLKYLTLYYHLNDCTTRSFHSKARKQFRFLSLFQKYHLQNQSRDSKRKLFMHSFELEDHLKHILKKEIIICQFLRKMGCHTMFFQLFLFYYDYYTAAMSKQCSV